MHPAHGVLISRGGPTIVFLTVCTRKRAPWLESANAHNALLSAWREANAWQVGRYVLMPGHLHLFCAPVDVEMPLDNWVRFWKSRFRRLTSGTGWFWQTDHWDTRLRRVENYDSKWEYVRQNPVRAGLSVHAEDWPFQGVIHELRW